MGIFKYPDYNSLSEAAGEHIVERLKSYETCLIGLSTGFSPKLTYFHIAKVYQLKNFMIWRKIILPQLYPYLMTSARTGLSLIWKIVLVFELLGRGSGIGFQIQVFFQFFDISSLLAYAIFFMTIILIIENFIMIPIEKKATHWRKND